ncbi:GNAT family N-acetyltransferase [Herbiconiux moechotypicola]|uniref:N-acetyltransferase domain-containing protein n=1 Tax=Herbiconiux moechotypicola TaxID=637393 RepID=A0ABP5QGI7_9MICO|nr:GNAT family N-acetyltransferase [Herbiconiux moechotypicola]MCS5730124.1 GNAT family N-acetyltransferase [Herbiconiux moechotypicola]
MFVEDFEVRRTVEEDWERVRDLRLEMLADTPLAYLETLEQAGRRPESHWRGWARDGSSEGSITVVAVTASGRWVGTMMSKVPRGASGAFLYGVYVAPDARGRAAGVTDALLERVESWASERGDTLTLEVHERNLRARAAYTSRGFVETGATTPYPLAAGGLEVVMVKRLST